MEGSTDYLGKCQDWSLLEFLKSGDQGQFAIIKASLLLAICLSFTDWHCECLLDLDCVVL